MPEINFTDAYFIGSDGVRTLEIYPPLPDPATNERNQAYVQQPDGSRLRLEGSPGEIRAMFEDDNPRFLDWRERN